MRHRAGGLLIENGKILLIHRIKNINGEIKEHSESELDLIKEKNVVINE